ncbi:MAG: CRISPR-associated endonuclease Cas1 [Planctomycetes bacterium]|nr:CRISPR-associated endonuclease Cas1 [Planctomycetota bacterium]
MLNEFVYCPRLAYLEWVQGEWRDNAEVAEGKFHHRRVDVEAGDLPSPEEVGGAAEGEEAAPERIHARSVLLSSAELGVIARIDLVEGEGSRVTPVDYKRGAAPDLPDGAWEADRIQVAAQALVLRDNGYACDAGVVYYVKSRRRVEVPIDDELARRCREAVAGLRALAEGGTIPPPLVNSPKCVRCSLAPICLPDEVTMLREAVASERDVRRIFPARDDAYPLYVQTHGLSVGVDGEVVQVREKGKVVREVRLLDVSQLCLMGNVQVTTQALRELLARGAPVCWFSVGGWFHGMAQGAFHKNVELRRRQFALAGDPERSLAVARALVAGKIRNCRTLLRRNHPEEPTAALAEMARLAEAAERAASMETLLGLEGAAARTYFAHFGALLRGGDTGAEGAAGVGPFDFDGRNRRPPVDPVNAMLSYLYAILAKDLAVTVQAVGFDPYLGFYHQPRYGRPALALDLMEEFRPLVADSVVITVVNKREVGPKDFLRRGGAVALTPAGRKAILRAYERRMDEWVTHPVFGYRVTYRRVLEIQARLLGRYLAGEIPEYVSFVTL